MDCVGLNHDRCDWDEEGGHEVMKYILLILEFFKTGLFSIGGGLATLPFLSQMGEKYGWFTQNELANMLAVSESTPGPIGVNMATYVGNSVGGLLGGVLTTLSLILPSYLVILVVCKIMDKFHGNPFVKNSMKMLRPASVGMVSAAVLSVLLSVLFRAEAILTLDWSAMVVLPNLILFAVLFMFYLKFNKLHPVVLIGLGAVAGIIFKL